MMMLLRVVGRVAMQSAHLSPINRDIRHDHDREHQHECAATCDCASRTTMIGGGGDDDEWAIDSRRGGAFVVVFVATWL